MRGPVAEIEADPALRFYGVALVATHLLTAYWLFHHDLASMVAFGQDAYCWPLVPDCDALRVLSAGQLRVAFGVYAALALASALAFLRPGTTVYGYAGLVVLTLFKLAVIALDFRLRRNQHYMAFAASAAFLFVPNRRATLQLLLVLFYFWAGTLKLNWEWLSGAALYRPLWLFTGRGVIVACAYVIVLELVIVWGLLARDRRIFWSSLAQVAVFHAFSWAVVGFFYPLLMAGLLAIYPLARLIPLPGGRRDLALPALRARRRRGLLAHAALDAPLPRRHRDHGRGPALRAAHVRRARGLRGEGHARASGRSPSRRRLDVGGWPHGLRPDHGARLGAEPVPQARHGRAALHRARLVAALAARDRRGAEGRDRDRALLREPAALRCIPAQ